MIKIIMIIARMSPQHLESLWSWASTQPLLNFPGLRRYTIITGEMQEHRNNVKKQWQQHSTTQHDGEAFSYKTHSSSPITHYLIHVLEGEGADWAEHKVGRVFKRKNIVYTFFSCQFLMLQPL